MSAQKPSVQIGLLSENERPFAALLDLIAYNSAFGVDGALMCTALARTKCGYGSSLERGSYDTYKPFATTELTLVQAFETDDAIAIYVGMTTTSTRCELHEAYRAFVAAHPELADGQTLRDRKLIMGPAHIVSRFIDSDVKIESDE